MTLGQPTAANPLVLPGLAENAETCCIQDVSSPIQRDPEKSKTPIEHQEPEKGDSNAPGFVAPESESGGSKVPDGFVDPESEHGGSKNQMDSLTGSLKMAAGTLHKEIVMAQRRPRTSLRVNCLSGQSRSARSALRLCLPLLLQIPQISRVRGSRFGI